MAGCNQKPPYYLTAYGLAVKHGFKGTEEEWLESLNGDSAYEIAVQLGFGGTKEEWLTSHIGNIVPELETLKAKVVSYCNASDGYARTAKASADEAKRNAEKCQEKFDAAINTMNIIGTESAAHPGCYYRLVNGETEWLNPPMVAGEEYRTAERHMGKAVYTKLVDCGKLPNNTVKYIVHNAALTQPLRCAAYIIGSDTLPVDFDVTEWRINVTCGTEYVCLETYKDRSGQSVRAQIWYIKD